MPAGARRRRRPLRRRPGRRGRPPPATPSAWPTTSALPRRRRRRALPGLGDAAVRAGQPERRDHGPAPAHAVAPAPTRVAGHPQVVVAPGAGPGPAARPARRRRRARSSSARATQVDPAELVERLVAVGYRREYQVEHRGEVARAGLDRRRVPVHRRRPGAHRPVGRRGRPPHRVLGQPTSAPPTIAPRSRSSRAASCCPTDDVRARAAALVAEPAVGPRAVGAAGRGPHVRRHGVVAAVAGRRRATSLDLLAADAQVLLVEPRRMRDRAADILAEEADLAGTLARPGAPTRLTTVPAAAPAVRPPAGPHQGAGVDRGHASPEGARHARGAAPAGWDPVVGDGRRLGAAAAPSCWPTATGWWWRPTAPGSAASLAPIAARGRASTCRSTRRARADLRRPRRPRRRGAPRAGLRAARGQAGRARRGRPHRPAPRPPPGPAPPARGGRLLRRPQAGRLRRAPPARRGPLRRHGHPGHRRRRARLPAARVPGRRQALRPVRPDRRRPPLHRRRQPVAHRLGGSDWHKTKARVRSAVQEIAQELVVLYQKRVHAAGHAFSPDTPWQRELEEAFPYEETPDQLKAIDDVKADMEAPAPMDRLVCGDVGFGKTEVAIRAAFKAVQDGKQVAVLVPTTLLAQQHFQTFSDRFAGYPVRVEVLSRFLTTGQAKQVARGLARGRGRRRHRHPPPALRRHRVQGPRPARGRRGAALRRDPQGGDQAAADRRRRAHPHGHADPPHARDEPHRHPRPHPAQHAAGRAPADPHLRRRVRRPGRGRGHPPRAAARGPGVLRAQPGAGHRAGGRRPPRAGARGPHRRRPRPDGRGHARAGRARLLGGRVRRAGLHHDHRVGHRHAHGEHAGRRPGRPARPRPAPPAAGPGRPGRAAGLRLPVLPARPGPVRGGLRAAQDHRRGHRARLGVQDRHARPRDPRRRQPARRGPVAATSPPSATTSTARWSPRRWPS